MGYYFSPFQIAEIAAELEEAGAEFYRRLADYNIHELSKEMCLLIADEELKHRDVFEQIAQAEQDHVTLSEFSTDMILKMQQLLESAKNKIFNLSPAEALTATSREILRFAVRVEEETIAIYEELYQIFSSKNQEILKKIIFEEKQHLMMFLNIEEILRANKTDE